jgi:hypothetical protein
MDAAMHDIRADRVQRSELSVGSVAASSLSFNETGIGGCEAARDSPSGGTGKQSLGSCSMADQGGLPLVRPGTRQSENQSIIEPAPSTTDVAQSGVVR